MNSTRATVDEPGPGSGSGAPGSPPRKTRRTLTVGNFFSTLGNVLASSPVLFMALFRPKTSAALREKVFLGVTSVSECRYCSWGHSHWALAHGVSLEEVNQILGQQIESLQARNPAEAAAILFAQHYAEYLEGYDPESIGNLRQYYDDGQVAEILGYVRLITLGNLTGNTVDALLERLRRGARMGKNTRATDGNQKIAQTTPVTMGWFWWWPFGSVPEISAQQLAVLCKHGSAPPQLLDVRTSTEWRSGHIAGAINVPIAEFNSRIDGLRLEGTRPIIAICRSAHRSVPAVRLLQRQGFRNACQLQGGMLAWHKAALPVEGDGGSNLPPN